MAVDYYHHLVVTGPRAGVADFAHRIAMVRTRRVAGVTTREASPFSFASLYAMANLKEEVPADPYDMVRWPVVRRGRGAAEVRYRFHTRSLEVHPLVRRLSRKVPRLTFALVTICLDDSDVAPFRIRNGRQQGGWLGGEWREPFWQRAAEARGLPLDEAYEDEGVEALAERWMLDEAVRMATRTTRRYRWDGGRVYRDLDDEREAFMRDLARAVTAAEQGS
jgi:hypothetical protein